jgi:hypothetical protein
VGKITGIVIGLLIGFAFGLVAMNYWNDRTPSNAAPSAQIETNTVVADSYFICKSGQTNRDSALIIKGDHSGAKTMLFPWHSEADEFRIERTTDLYYKAVEARPPVSEAYGSLELNRVSGDLTATSRISSEAVKLLTAICDKRIPPNECRSRIESIGGASWVDCMSVANDLECPRLRSGNNISGRFRYECRSAERRF